MQSTCVCLVGDLSLPLLWQHACYVGADNFFFFFFPHLSALEMVGYILYTIPTCPITKAFTGWGLPIVISVLTIASKCYALRLACLLFKSGGKANRCSLWGSAGSGAVKEQGGVWAAAEKSCANEVAICPGSPYICRQSFILFLIVRLCHILSPGCRICLFCGRVVYSNRWVGIEGDFCLAQPCFVGSVVLGNGFPCLYSLFYFFFLLPPWGI